MKKKEKISGAKSRSMATCGRQGMKDGKKNTIPIFRVLLFKHVLCKKNVTIGKGKSPKLVFLNFYFLYFKNLGLSFLTLLP